MVGRKGAQAEKKPGFWWRTYHVFQRGAQTSAWQVRALLSRMRLVPKGKGSARRW
ncbi:hypothetical protein [Rhodothermus profundi]|uniref:Uncharacterized protein n=1 Tax=Rhodothermus profundi TaxID=633813 RepID=A0A1M6WMB2_9BACT|nr:hypothetical protein [Rhodothermus profundi]SHK94902.1 hypothetical protein SAMN04488087_2355 [Rhodothermus profundi]